MSTRSDGQPAVFAGDPTTGRLTEDEQKLVAKLLSDPTYFPVEYKSWLKNFIEGSGITLPQSSIVGGGVGPRTQLPPGLIMPVAANALPPDVLLCDGASYLRADYLALFNAIGTTWGSVDGTHFNVPDLRDRALYGQGAKVGLGQHDGEAFGSRGGPFHKHSFNQTSGAAGGHSHSVSVSGSTSGVGGHTHPSTGGAFAVGTFATAALGSGGTTRYIVGNFVNDTGSGGDHSHSFSGSGSASSVGDHTHNVNGDTSGGYGYDHPSWAGVFLGITTGA